MTQLITLLRHAVLAWTALASAVAAIAGLGIVLDHLERRFTGQAADTWNDPLDDIAEASHVQERNVDRTR